MDWGNCVMREVTAGADGQVTAIAGELHLEGDFKKTKLKLTWLADVPDVVPLRIVTLGYLITKAKVRTRRLPCVRVQSLYTDWAGLFLWCGVVTGAWGAVGGGGQL